MKQNTRHRNKVYWEVAMRQQLQTKQNNVALLTLTFMIISEQDCQEEVLSLSPVMQTHHFRVRSIHS